MDGADAEPSRGLSPSYSGVQYVAYLFSGHRRAGDMFSQPSWTLGHESVRLLPVDIVFGKEGDLLSGSTVDCLRRLILADVIAAAIACPPCETWIAA